MAELAEETLPTRRGPIWVHSNRWEEGVKRLSLGSEEVHDLQEGPAQEWRHTNPIAPQLQFQTAETEEPGSFWREKKTNTSQPKGLGMRRALDFSSSNRQKTMNRAVRILSQNINQKQRQNTNVFRLARIREIIFQASFLRKLLEMSFSKMRE